MRCTRCDELAIPQATGRTPDGRLVFGWCVHCLEDAECVDIVVAQTGRKRRPAVRPRPPQVRPNLTQVSPLLPTALGMSSWGLVLICVGVVRRFVGSDDPPSPLGNGTPALLLGGGIVALTFGLFLLRHARPPSSRGNRGWDTLRLLAFLWAMFTLLLGVIYYEPRRNILIVSLAFAFLGVSYTAQRLASPTEEPQHASDEVLL